MWLHEDALSGEKIFKVNLIECYITKLNKFSLLLLFYIITNIHNILCVCFTLITKLIIILLRFNLKNLEPLPLFLNNLGLKTMVTPAL